MREVHNRGIALRNDARVMLYDFMPFEAVLLVLKVITGRLQNSIQMGNSEKYRSRRQTLQIAKRVDNIRGFMLQKTARVWSNTGPLELRSKDLYYLSFNI